MVEHEILLDEYSSNKMKNGKKDHSMAHNLPNSVLLEPRDTGEIIWSLALQQN